MQEMMNLLRSALFGRDLYVCTFQQVFGLPSPKIPDIHIPCFVVGIQLTSVSEESKVGVAH
jgi:hypothetical protein